jgi:hypothetical protein
MSIYMVIDHFLLAEVSTVATKLAKKYLAVKIKQDFVQEICTVDTGVLPQVLRQLIPFFNRCSTVWTLVLQVSLQDSFQVCQRN